MQRPQDFAKIITYPLCVLGAFIKNKLITYAWICFMFLYIVLVGDVASLEVNTILFNYDTLYYIFQSGAYSLQYCFLFCFKIIVPDMEKFSFKFLIREVQETYITI